MESGYLIGAFSVFWMGILATISPCPLGTNVAAVSIITAGGGGNPQNSLAVSGAYGLGRMLTHTLVGLLIMKGFATASSATAMMQAIPSKLIGPFFIILAVLLSGRLDIHMPHGAAKLKNSILKSGVIGPRQTFVVGCVFALIPCPETAALFFGGLIPLAMDANSLLAYPLLFGLGTALPVMIIGLLLARGVGKFANKLGEIRRVEPFLRGLTSFVFAAVGIYLTLVYVCGFWQHAH